MAIIPVPKAYPPPIAWQGRIRNGKIPDWRSMTMPMRRHLFALTHCRKLIFHKSVQPGSTPQSLAGTSIPWRWQFRTGESNYSGGNVIKLYAEAQVLPASSTSGTDPRWRFFAGATNSGYRRMPAEVTSPTYGDVSSQRAILGPLAANTEYQCGLELEDYGRVVSLTVWESVPLEADSAATYVSGTIRTLGNEKEITDAQHEDLAVDPMTIWKHGGAHICSLVPDTLAAPWTTSSATYVNMLDAAASTTVGANTAGINASVQYHNPVHTNDVSAVFAVYAASAADGGTDSIKLESGSAETLGELNTFSSAGEWKSVAVVLNGSLSAHKVDIQFRDTNSSTFTVYAVSLYEYEA